MAHPEGRRFWKMSGSGNDFVFFDVRDEPPGNLEEPALVEAICAHRTGVGADGVVFLGRSDRAPVRMTYLNADGSRAMCGNATLCAARLAVELGAAPRTGLVVETDSGLVDARMRDTDPELDLPAVTEVSPAFSAPLDRGELRIGFADIGVPHLVILCDDVETVDVVGRGRPLRHLASLQAGANVNFISPDPAASSRWRMRTYERGVEAETLACGTGAVACGILLAEWGEGGLDTELLTRSGRILRVRLRRGDGRWLPSLSGEARIVYTGALGDIGVREY